MPPKYEIGTNILRIGRSSYTFGNAVFHDDVCVATSEATSVMIDRATGKSIPLPAEFRESLQALMRPDLRPGH